MALSKTSGIIAGIAFLVLGAAAVTGGVFLKNKMDSLYTVDLATEEQKCLFVGTFKKVDGYQVRVTVRMTAPFHDPVVKEVYPEDFTYDTGSQQSDQTQWIDLKDWAMAITGDVRLDTWMETGGILDFQSWCGSAASARKAVKSGGGSYLVYEPSDDGSLKVEHQGVVLQIPGEDIS